MPITFLPPYAQLPRLLLLGALAASLGACSVAPRTEQQLGSSMRLAQAQQTINPQARYNRAQVNGLDAQAAKSVYDNYQRSYASPEQQQNSFTIGVGK